MAKIEKTSTFAPGATVTLTFDDVDMVLEKVQVRNRGERVGELQLIITTLDNEIFVATNGNTLNYNIPTPLRPPVEWKTTSKGNRQYLSGVEWRAGFVV